MISDDVMLHRHGCRSSLSSYLYVRLLSCSGFPYWSASPDMFSYCIGQRATAQACESNALLDDLSHKINQSTKTEILASASSDQLNSSLLVDIIVCFDTNFYQFQVGT